MAMPKAFPACRSHRETARSDILLRSLTGSHKKARETRVSRRACSQFVATPEGPAVNGRPSRRTYRRAQLVEQDQSDWSISRRWWLRSDSTEPRVGGNGLPL